MDYYETLGVTKDTPAEDIKKAYKKLASKYHPDKAGGDTAKFQTVQAAYDTIGDPQKKAQYDMQQSGGGGHHFFNMGGMSPEDMMGGHDMFNIFRSHFNNGRPQQQRNRDLRVSVEVTLYDTLAEHTKTLSIQHGNTKKNVDIKVPRGIFSGATIKFAGLGLSEIASAPPSDLYVDFFIQPHPVFEVRDSNLLTTITITSLDAMLGCSKEVASIDGKKYNITIPAGTQYGAKFGIPDAGLYILQTENRGKLIISVAITTLRITSPGLIEKLKEINAALLNQGE